jgi:hypothetical protein
MFSPVDMATQSKNTTVLCLVGLVLSTVSFLQLLWILFLTNLECRLDPEDVPPEVSTQINLVLAAFDIS